MKKNRDLKGVLRTAQKEFKKGKKAFGEKKFTEAQTSFQAAEKTFKEAGDRGSANTAKQWLKCIP